MDSGYSTRHWANLLQCNSRENSSITKLTGLRMRNFCNFFSLFNAKLSTQLYRLHGFARLAFSNLPALEGKKFISVQHRDEPWLVSQTRLWCRWQVQNPSGRRPNQSRFFTWYPCRQLPAVSETFKVKKNLKPSRRGWLSWSKRKNLYCEGD
jgi:hypothetical protein